MSDISFLKNKANQIRGEVIKIAVPHGAGHIAPSLSCVDILTALYYGCMSYKTDDPRWEDRDRLVFSKGHGCYALYAILADLGVIPAEKWKAFYTEKSDLAGCIERHVEYGLEAGCGSLGHGLPIATGLAFGAKMQGKGYYVFCVLGDGELQEGSTWEALQFAVKRKVNNLVIIIDNNRLQAMDFLINILYREKSDIIKRLRGFGLLPVTCQGHNMSKLLNCLNNAKSARLKVPRVIIADTIKGYGLKCMENVPKFHFRIPTNEELSMGKTYE